MSIASDLRSYADTAVNQGKQVLDSTISTASAQLTDVTGQANEFYGKTKESVVEIAGKASSAVQDLRSSAEKAVNLNAIKTAVEPYVAQVKGYTHQVTDRAEALLAGAKIDTQLATLVGTVQERVVQPVLSLTGRGSKPAQATPTPAPAKPAAATKAATKPAATKPATAKPAPAKPATKSAATKPAATTARKAPAKRTTNS
jgi:hypothetical protein